MFNSKYSKVFFFIIFFFFIEFFLFKNTPFFWDAVSKSLRARWFFDNDFSQLVIPTEINSGHPPLWTLLLSAWWKLFGMTLFSSRVLLLIINILIGYQILILFKNYFKTDVSIFFIFLIFIEPTFIAQTTILNNDMLLLLFTLSAYNFISGSKKINYILYTLILTGILFSNLRGMLIFSCLLIVDILFNRFKLRSKNNNFNFIPYLISGVILGVFFIYQYNLLGWIIKTPSTNWSGQRKSADFFHIIKNIASVTRNLLDYGRVAIIVLTSFLLFKYFKAKKINSKVTELLITFIVFSFGLSAFFIFFTNPIGHRYYMFAYIILVMLFIQLIHIININKIKMYTAIVVLAFLTGHFWIYPSTISQGWDSSLAYLNYFESRNSMEKYIQDNKILKGETGTNLPLNSKKYSDLLINENLENYADLDLKKNKYVIFSNIENSTSDEDIKALYDNWIVVKKYNNLGVFIILFENPNYRNNYYSPVQ